MLLFYPEVTIHDHLKGVLSFNMPYFSWCSVNVITYLQHVNCHFDMFFSCKKHFICMMFTSKWITSHDPGETLKTINNYNKKNRPLFRIDGFGGAKALLTWAQKRPLFSSNFLSVWSTFPKLELKKGTFSAPCQQGLREHFMSLKRACFQRWNWVVYYIQAQNWIWKGHFIGTCKRPLKLLKFWSGIFINGRSGNLTGI